MTKIIVEPCYESGIWRIFNKVINLKSKSYENDPRSGKRSQS